jgi:hypothetical protein
MPGIFFTRGAQLRIPGGAIKIRMTDDGPAVDPEPVQPELRMDLWPHWLHEALDATVAGWHQVRWDGHVPTSGSTFRRLHDAAWSAPAQLVAGRELLREIVCVGGDDAASDAQCSGLGVDVAAAQFGELAEPQCAPGREQDQ